MTEEFELFWHGPLSQWEESYFTIDGVEYNCCEQYMMAEKARLFEDEETLDMIMEAEDPLTQKKLGRVVSGYSDGVWQRDEPNGYPHCWNIVWRGNMAKFSQNNWLKRQLLATEGTLVEASPNDRIWGIGLKASSPLARDRSSWPGLNWLGEVLTSVRQHLETFDGVYDTVEDLRQA